MLSAALSGHVGALNVLIRAKADVNAVNVVSLIFIYILHEIIFIVQIINLRGKKQTKEALSATCICMYVSLYPPLLSFAHMHIKVMHSVTLVNKKQAV